MMDSAEGKITMGMDFAVWNRECLGIDGSVRLG